MLTLTERIESSQSAPGAGTVRFMSGDESHAVEWGRILEQATGVAARLQAKGIGPGSHVALLGPTTPELVTAIEATWLCGATLIVLPLPMRLASIDAFVAQTRARIVSADTDLLIADRQLAAFLDEKDNPTMLDDLVAGAHHPGAWERPPVDPDSLAILQFTSGSTSDPKGVMLPHRNICHNLDSIATAAHLDPENDVLVSWLPLYHDMGLIGMLGEPMTNALNMVLAAPQDFLAAPARWMNWMSEYHGTVTAGPNFAYALAARALKRQTETLDLSRWRLGLNGAEPIDPSSVEQFAALAQPHGLDARAMFTVFGMAEATLGVTFPTPFSGMSVDTVDRHALEHERLAVATDDRERGMRLAKLGRALPGLEIRIADPATGDVMVAREVGELEIRGNSVTPGYYKKPELTAATFHDGWLRTGDLGYLVDGELVICGRIKDVIIVGGRNVFPEDVERAVGRVEGVRAGNVIAFGVERRSGREGIVVVAEARDGAVRDAVADQVREAVGLPGEVVLVEPGTLPKTSSGKLQRSLCRDRYLDEDLQLV
jgi:fatty-acyl-CoA synthase